MAYEEENIPTDILINFDENNESVSSLGSAAISDTMPWGQYPHKPICQELWDKSVADSLDLIATDNPYLYIFIKENLFSLTRGCSLSPPKLEGLGQ